MSEADSPNTESSFSPAPEVDNNPPVADNDWQTVDFPGAISLDEIAASLPESEPPLADRSNSELVELVQQLRQENLELRDRLAQLAEDLVQGQIEYQLEAARLEQPEVVVASPQVQPVPELAITQERIAQLFHELKLSQQAAQRQQILVETITEQLESSQERIAQLERDCALTQQRYNEQLQQLWQAENTCRDLRLRLHRQQQHTLQFKAALEKCLEMPASYRQGNFMAEPNPEENIAASIATATANSLSQVLAPKNQPVKPWSVAAALADTKDAQGQSDPVFKLLHTNLESEDLEAAVSPAPQPAVKSGPVLPLTGSKPAQLEPEDPEFVANLMNLIFPDGSPETTYSETTYRVDGEAPEAAIFDLSPFIAAEGDNTTISTSEEDQALLQLLAAVPLTTEQIGEVVPSGSPQADPEEQADALWEDLEKLITPSQVEAPEVPSLPALQETVEAVAIAPEVEETTPASEATLEPETFKLDARAWEAIRAHQENPVKSRSSHFFNLTVASKGGADSSTGVATVEQNASPSWPSPVIYPTRSAKKLSSLAAVDLPSFPRPGR